MTSVKLITAGSEDIVAYCARVSNPANQDNENIAGLLRYCMRHGHWSIFELANAVLEVETTRDIARQLLRHRSFSFQEFSQRYAVADLGWDLKDARLQDTKNRQNSIETDDMLLENEWVRAQKRAIYAAEREYRWALDNGIAKEQARAVLPEGLTVSRLYMQGTLRSWLHYIELRSGPETQKEHREIAQACAAALESIFPMVSEFLVK